MKLSISNIGWNSEKNQAVYSIMQKYGFCGLEIAPTIVFGENPYSDLNKVSEWSRKIKSEYGFEIPSIQSIWYARQEKLFESKEDYDFLVEYTKKAIDFAEAVGSKNIVFGCPKNRNIPENGSSEREYDFFHTLGEYASAHKTVLAIEANPTIYNTNYINTTVQALELVKKIGSEGCRLNLDIGTMIENSEDISILEGNVQYINHIHISEPYMKVLEHRELHKKLADFLADEKYDKFVSIEMSRQEDIGVLEGCCSYIKEIFL